MEFVNIIKDVGIVAFVVVAMMKQQEKKDSHMIQTNERLLKTNETLAKGVTHIVQDVKETKYKVDNMENVMIKIADTIGVAHE